MEAAATLTHVPTIEFTDEDIATLEHASLRLIAGQHFPHRIRLEVLPSAITLLQRFLDQRGALTDTNEVRMRERAAILVGRLMKIRDGRER